MEVLVGVEAGFQAESVGSAAQVGHRRSRRLLHHVAQLAGEDQLAGALHQADFALQQLTARLGPGQTGGDADLGLVELLVGPELRLAEEFPDQFPVDRDRTLATLGLLGLRTALGLRTGLQLLRAALFDQPAGQLATDRRDLALEVADARLARVGVHQVTQAVLAEADRVRGQTMAVQLPRHQELARDLELLVRRVPGELDDLHPVLERRRNRVLDVRGGDEHDPGEVVLDVHVVIDEGVVLLRIEHLEQRGRWIAAEVHRHLVDLVEEEDRVDRARPLHHLDDLTGKRADVRTAVSADLGLVADPA